MAQLSIQMIIFSILLILIADIGSVSSTDVDEHSYVYYRKSELDEIPKSNSKNNATWNKAATFLHDAINNNDHHGIIDILIIKNLFHRATIADAYHSKYQTQLKLKIKSQFFGDFEHLMTALLTPDLDYLVEEVHDAIHHYSESKNKTFLDIFCRRNYMEIDKIKNLYPLYYRKELSEDLLKLPPGLFRSSLIDFTLGVLRIQNFLSFGFGSGKQSPSIYPRDPLSLCTEGVYDYYATRLHESLKTNDHRSTTRLIVITLNENTLHHIIERYEELYNSSLRAKIHHHTDKFYRRSLLAIIDVVDHTNYLFK